MDGPPSVHCIHRLGNMLTIPTRFVELISHCVCLPCCLSVWLPVCALVRRIKLPASCRYITSLERIGGGLIDDAGSRGTIHNTFMLHGGRVELLLVWLLRGVWLWLGAEQG